MALQIRRGLEADRVTFAPAQGELLYTTDDKKLYIGDGLTVGGNAVGGGDLVTETTAAQFVHNQHSNLSFTYDVGTGKIIGSIPNFNIQIAASDSTVRTVNLGETIQFIGTGGITTSSDSEGNITISGSGGGGGSSNSFETIVVAGQSNVVAESSTDVLILVAGNGIDITTNAGADAITIASTVNSFSTVFVPGQGNVIAENANTGLILLGQNGISITTDPVTDTITFSNTIFNFDRISVLGAPAQVVADSFQDTLYLIPGPGIEITVDPLTDAIVIAASPSSTVTSINDLEDVNITTTGMSFGESLVWDNFAFVNQQLVDISALGSIPFFSASQTLTGADQLTYDNITDTLSAVNIDVDVVKALRIESEFAGGLTVVSKINPYTTFGSVLNDPAPTQYGGQIQTLDLTYEVDGPGNIFLTVHSTDSNINPQLGLYRARGTLLALQPVFTDDILGAISFNGYNGVQSRPAGKIGVKCETGPTFGGSIVPGSMFIQLTNNDGVLQSVLTITSNGRVDLTGELFVAKQINNNTIRINNNIIETIVSNANLELRTSGSGAIYLDNISINQGVIDTLDSSALVVTPAAIFSSDVTVQNNLIVSNKVYAEEFVSTSNVTPEISAATVLAVKVGNKEWNYSNNGTFNYPILSSAPSSPVNGMTAIADGIGWNPLSLSGKQQMVVYLGGGWRQIAVEP